MAYDFKPPKTKRSDFSAWHIQQRMLEDDFRKGVIDQKQFDARSQELLEGFSIDVNDFYDGWTSREEYQGALEEASTLPGMLSFDLESCVKHEGEHFDKAVELGYGPEKGYDTSLGFLLLIADNLVGTKYELQAFCKTPDNLPSEDIHKICEAPEGELSHTDTGDSSQYAVELLHGVIPMEPWKCAAYLVGYGVNETLILENLEAIAELVSTDSEASQFAGRNWKPQYFEPVAHSIVQGISPEDEQETRELWSEGPFGDRSHYLDN